MDENKNNDIPDIENDNHVVPEPIEEKNQNQADSTSQQNNDVQNNDAAQQPQNTQQNTAYQPQQTQYVSPEANYNPYQNYQQNTQYYTGVNNVNNAASDDKQGKSKGMRIVLIIIAVILATALIILGAIIIKKGGLIKLNGEPATERLTGDGTVITTAPTITGKPVDSERVAEIARVSNVGVLVYSSGGYFTPETEAGEGTGVVASVSKDGKSTYIITCAHVISDSGISVKILLEDGTTYDAAIVGFDLQTDIGVLKVNTTGLTCAQFGDSSQLKVGAPVYAVGNPGGSEFFGSFTGGIVSSIGRSINNEIGYTMECIQHDAAINPGNSGGALLNSSGQVVGINSAKIASAEYEGMGFAIPISTALEIANQLIEYGYVPNRPKLGITYSLATSHDAYAMVVRLKGLPAGSLVIRSISSDSALNDSGILVGDMITAVNGTELDTADILLDIVDNSKVGDSLTLTICRVNSDYSIEEFDVTVELIEDKGTTEDEDSTYVDPFDYFEQYEY